MQFHTAGSPATVDHQEKEDTMFARMIQLTAKPGRGEELNQTMGDRALSILRQQPGLVDAIALVSENDPDQFVGLSIWKSKADADKFQQGQSQQLLETFKPLLQGEPKFHSFNVASSTIQGASSARAASR
jgi:quinol monooxygenase YgiN